ncbi:DUF4468 domain-containing protein [Pedobacter mucosus]|uniref:DUF4468 domain-containing protein n=1 Tax=Pedobacter mucosus TaxID=2895286 RepID=UPI001EE49DF0|nr:DUF4468 domain-containing protein [Pedobacter mucosus]UKT65601.1 DUF4468 domain-containing protein [Pedobacter mucosus]
MKRTLLTLLALLPLLAFSQDTDKKDKNEPTENLTIPTKDGVIFYEQVAQCTDTQKDLYFKARKWFVDTFNSAKSVLQMEDKEEGSLAGKAFYTYDFNNGMSTSKVTIDFTLNLDIKEGKYRVQFYDMYGSNKNVNGGLAMLGALSGNYNASNDATTIRKVDYNLVLKDLTAGKRVKYNQKILDGMNNQVKFLFASLETAMKKPRKDDF